MLGIIYFPSHIQVARSGRTVRATLQPHIDRYERKRQQRILVTRLMENSAYEKREQIQPSGNIHPCSPIGVSISHPPHFDTCLSHSTRT